MHNDLNIKIKKSQFNKDNYYTHCKLEDNGKSFKKDVKKTYPSLIHKSVAYNVKIQYIIYRHYKEKTKGRFD